MKQFENTTRLRGVRPERPVHPDPHPESPERPIYTPPRTQTMDVQHGEMGFIRRKTMLLLAMASTASVIALSQISAVRAVVAPVVGGEQTASVQADQVAPPMVDCYVATNLPENPSEPVGNLSANTLNTTSEESNAVTLSATLPVMYGHKQMPIDKCVVTSPY